MDFTEVTDAGLAHLKGMVNLENLHLGNAQMTDAGLAEIEGLTNLRFLSLDHTWVTDAGLVHLQGMAKLRQLTLAGTPVTAAGAASLRQALPRLGISPSRLPRAGSAEPEESAWRRPPPPGWSAPGIH